MQSEIIDHAMYGHFPRDTFEAVFFLGGGGEGGAGNYRGTILRS